MSDDDTRDGERCHTDSCDHIADLETRVQELLRANGEMAMVWAEQQEQIAELERRRGRSWEAQAIDRIYRP